MRTSYKSQRKNKSTFFFGKCESEIRKRIKILLFLFFPNLIHLQVNKGYKRRSSLLILITAVPGRQCRPRVAIQQARDDCTIHGIPYNRPQDRGQGSAQPTAKCPTLSSRLGNQADRSGSQAGGLGSGQWTRQAGHVDQAANSGSRQAVWFFGAACKLLGQERKFSNL